jgi:hypothetical protein
MKTAYQERIVIPEAQRKLAENEVIKSLDNEQLKSLIEHSQYCVDLL